MSKILTIFSGYLFVLAAIGLRIFSYYSDMKPDEMDVFGVIPFDAMLLASGIMLIFASTKSVSGFLSGLLRAWRGSGYTDRASRDNQNDRGRNGPQS